MANKLISVNTWESKARQRKKRQIREGFFRFKKQQQKRKSHTTRKQWNTYRLSKCAFSSSVKLTSFSSNIFSSSTAKQKLNYTRVNNLRSGKLNPYSSTITCCPGNLLRLAWDQGPRSQGSLLPVPTERWTDWWTAMKGMMKGRRRVGERTWERGCSMGRERVGKGLGLGRVRVSPPQTTVRVTSLTDIYFSITLQSQETLVFL